MFQRDTEVRPALEPIKFKGGDPHENVLIGCPKIQPIRFTTDAMLSPTGYNPIGKSVVLRRSAESPVLDQA